MTNPINAALMFAALTIVAPMVSADTPLERDLAFWLECDDEKTLPMLVELAVEGDV